MSVRRVCPNLECGVEHWVPDHVNAQAVNNKERRVFCPNGHPSVYIEDEVERLKKRVAELEASVEREQARYYRMEEDALKDERRISYWKGQVTRWKRKVRK